MTGIPSTPSNPLQARAAATPPLPAFATGPGSTPALPATAPATAPAFSSVGVLLAALEKPVDGQHVELPAPGSLVARDVQGLLSRRLVQLTDEASLPRQPALRLDVEPDGQVRVRASSAHAPALQLLVDRHVDVQALARLLHAIEAGRPHGDPRLSGRCDPAQAASDRTGVPRCGMRAPWLEWPYALPTGANAGLSVWVWGGIALAALLAWCL